MAGEEMLVFWAGAVIFGLATLLFVVLKLRRPEYGIFYGSDIFVCFITTISYVTMALALGTSVAADGQPIYWTRWLYYIASCSILTLDVAYLAGRPTVTKFEVALFTGLVMFCGFLASFLTGPERWWFFAFSSAAYAGLLYTLFAGTGRAEPGMKPVMWFILLFWTLFPVVWVLAPTGLGIITTPAGAVLYAILDIITKIVFGLWITMRILPFRQPIG
ncbi:hypothetical protein ABH15_09795 [Methanoculleus taiwanensis]|uniref:Rhodopsin n=1 Tax=Methanoculleus taiwanensis TaxID=1550565 RepID=A0A498H310_9EURY|nr:bacteriorhodopsin [Methanoculleus taiwanensis]RXE56376.1 hypothetical protein ABH15_09795 [Methanoculleus taiwanensis]